MRVNKNYWLCQFIGWGTYGIFENTVNYLSGRNLSKEAPYTLVFVLMGITLTHLYRLAVLKKYNWAKLSLQSLAIRVILASVIIGTTFALYLCYQAIEIEKERPTFKFYYFLIFFLNTMLMSLVWNLIYFIWKYINSNKKLAVEKVAFEMANKDLELQNIKSKLQPHFIFNALNSIKALIDEDPEKARVSVLQLSNILRNSLVSDKEELVTLEKELKIVSDYLSLECVRYEERLHVDYKIHELTLKTMIPPLILQTVVENAIKHGIATENNGGFIKIVTSLANDNKTIINIENSGTYMPFASNTKVGGFGLSSSSKRLAFLFGNIATLAITNTNNNTVLTTITLPNQA